MSYTGNMNKYRLKYSCICCVIYVHIFCYIRSYMCILLTCVHIFCRQIPQSNNTGMYEHVCTYIKKICTYMHKYIQNTCKIHAKYRSYNRAWRCSYVKADIISVCIGTYRYILFLYVHVFFGEFIFACINTYMHIFARICLYLRKCLYHNPDQTEIDWNAYKHVFVCICMYHRYMYIYACI